MVDAFKWHVGQTSGTIIDLRAVAAFEPIPEPTTATLAACALLGLVCRRKRQVPQYLT